MRNSYKEYVENCENARFELTAFRKTTITIENLKTELEGKVMTTWEKVPAKEVLTLLNLLIYKITSHKLGFTTLANTDLSWCERQAAMLKKYLNGSDQTQTFFTPKHMYQFIRYEVLLYESPNELVGDDKENVGRLYAHRCNSIQFFPREIRMFLFRENYRDFDMKNAHPTLLFDFVQFEDIKLDGAIENYINNRDAVLTQIENELLQSRLLRKTREPNFVDAKLEVIVHLNRTWDKHSCLASKTLDNLDNEFEIIRDYLWSKLERGELPEYEIPVYNHKLDSNLAQKKVRLLSLFFQTRETTQLFKLKRFLEEKYLFLLESAGKTLFVDYEPFIDRDIDLPAMAGLSIIPFFDGLYVSFLDENFNDNLSDIIDEFNILSKKAGSNVEFIEKEIDVEPQYLKSSPVEAANFRFVTDWLLDADNFHLLQTYLFYIPDVKQCVKELNSMSPEQEQIRDSIHFLNDKIHTYLYRSLLEAGVEFKSTLDVNRLVEDVIRREKLPGKALGELRNTYDNILSQEPKSSDDIKV